MCWGQKMTSSKRTRRTQATRRTTSLSHGTCATTVCGVEFSADLHSRWATGSTWSCLQGRTSASPLHKSTTLTPTDGRNGMSAWQQACVSLSPYPYVRTCTHARPTWKLTPPSVPEQARLVECVQVLPPVQHPTLPSGDAGVPHLPGAHAERSSSTRDCCLPVSVGLWAASHPQRGVWSYSVRLQLPENAASNTGCCVILRTGCWTCWRTQASMPLSQRVPCSVLSVMVGFSSRLTRT